MADETNIPAGWYRRPNNPTQERYWDGSVWTDATRNAPSAGQSGTVRPVKAAHGRGRRPLWAYAATGLLVVVMAAVVVLLLSSSGNKTTPSKDEQPSQHLSPMAYRALAADTLDSSKVVAGGGAHPCTAAPSNADTQTLIIIKICGANRQISEYEKEKSTTCPLISQVILAPNMIRGSTSTLRSCLLSYYHIRAEKIKVRITDTSQMITTLLPGECRTLFQKTEQLLTNLILIPEHFVSKIMTARNKNEISAALVKIAKTEGPSVIKQVKGEHEIQSACRPPGSPSMEGILRELEKQ